MYKIGYAWEPGELSKDADYWTLDIDYEQGEKDALQSHGAILQIHGETLSACLLRGKLICDLLNDKTVHGVEMYVQFMGLAKAITVKRMEYKEKEDA